MPSVNISYQSMAYYNKAWVAYKAGNAGWVGRNNYSGYRCVAIQLTIPSFSGVSTYLDISVPISLATGDSTQEINVAITNTDPTTLGTVYPALTPGGDSGRIYSARHTISGLSAAAVQNISISIPSSVISGGETYYLVLGPGSEAYNEGYVYIYSGSGYNFTGELSYGYPASQPTVSDASVFLGSDITIATNRQNSNYTHTITYSFAGATGTISENVGESITWAPPISLASNIPNGTNGTCIITCKTYQGGTVYGSKTVNVTLKVPSSVVPVISSFTATRVDNGVPSSWGIYVSGYSKATLKTIASGAYGSTISSYSITGGLYGETVTTGVLTQPGTNTWTVTVTDSRGRTATKQISVTVVAYSDPVISNPLFERCNSDGSVNDEGAYIKIKASISISSCDGKNSYTSSLQYKLTTSSAWITAGNYVSSGVEQIYDANLIDSAYDIRILVTDGIKSVYAGGTLDIGDMIAEYFPEDKELEFLVPVKFSTSVFSRTLLWSNAATTSSFANQTILSDVSGYDILIITGRYNTAYGYESMVLMPVLNSRYCSVYFPAGSIGSYTFPSTVSRYFGISNNALVAQQGYKDGTVDNTSCVPVAVYGIKFNGG